MAQSAKKYTNNNETVMDIKEEDIVKGVIKIEETDDIPEGAEVIDYVNVVNDNKKDTSKEDEIKKLKAELNERDKKLDEFSKNFAMMQAQMEMLMKANLNSKPNSNEDEEILVGCRGIMGGVLATSDGRYDYKFGCDEEKYISAYDLKEIFKESGLRDNKKSFERDFFYFVDENNYSKFKIKKRIDLSFENVKRILLLPVHDMIDEINLMTNNLINFQITHAFQYQVVKMLVNKSNPLSNWKYDNRVALENYIGQKFDSLMASIGAVELLGRKNFSE